MPAPKNIEQLVNELPELDKRGKVDGPTREVGYKLFDALLAAGGAGVAGVVAMIHEVDDGADYKARYALRGMTMRAGSPGQGKQRAKLAGALCEQLGKNLPVTTKNFLLGELQFVAGAESVGTLGGALGDETLFDRAMAALLAIGGDAVAAQFRGELAGATGRRRVAIVTGLGELKDKAAISELRKAVGAGETKVAAMCALANLGDAGSADLLLKAAAAATEFERIKATSACLLLAEACAAAGDKSTARRIYRRLHDTCGGPDEQHVRAAAADGLKG